uniref:Galactose oxidase n=1 Tax=Kalanchoe fedtschenkoi TaxID=63787 RepID=A0A7N0SVN5_KALFE
MGRSACLLMLLFVAFTPGFPAKASASDAGSGGRWKVVLNSTGVVGMHMAVTHQNKVIMFDQTGTVQSGCGRRARDSEDWSCYAHSVEYDIGSNRIRPLRLETDPWCSSGAFLSNGTLLQLGGYRNGTRRIRFYDSCSNGGCDWAQAARTLADKRWYSSSQILPDADQVVLVGGRRVFTYEFFPRGETEGSHSLPFLRDTALETDKIRGSYYPFLHLCSDGNLFLMADRDSILYNYRRRRLVLTFPRIPGGGSRTHPNTGSSVILPLDHKNNFRKVEVMVCGGAAKNAEREARRGRFLTGLSTCGRMVITGENPMWHMESMPGPRLMQDMLILPTGGILIINGARSGSAGFNKARNASLQPYLYEPKNRSGQRFSLLKSTKIARMYHSSAVLLPDGRVLVSGSNPNNRYAFRDVVYPTELRLQTYTPHYMHSHFDTSRPRNISVEYDAGIDPTGATYGGKFYVRFWMGGSKLDKKVEYTAYAPPFTTHSISMNQRLLLLRCTDMVRNKDGWVNVVLEAPSSPNMAPAGYYLLTVVNDGIPSVSHWIRFIRASRHQ